MVERIKLIMEYKQMTPAQFAESLGINRSNLTHIFTGRNLPSLEFVRKILTTFPDISTEWLIMNVGNMLTSANQDFEFIDNSDVSKITSKTEPAKLFIQPDLFHDQSSGELNISAKEDKNKTISDSKEVENEVPVNNEDSIPFLNDIQAINSVDFKLEQDKSEITSQNTPSNKKIEKVMFFYTNKTFDTYYPE